MGSVVFRNVWKRYDNKVEAVKNLNLECKEGEFLALLGPSGCGKTSSLRMVAGLEQVTEGDVLIDGKRVNDLKPRERDIAMAFEAYALYPHLTAYENIAFPLRIRGITQREIDRKVKEIAEILQIGEILDRRPANLSGGQQQRVSFARAMVRPASVYLMDEPLSHLDAKQRGQLRSELKRLHKVKGLTIIFVTHDQIEALAMADRIAVMNGGVLQQVDKPKELFGSPNNLFVADFVGEPPMNLLPARLRAEGERVLVDVGGLSVEIPEGPRREAGRRFLGRDAIFGIRPLHVTAHTANNAAGTWPGAAVYVAESLGDYSIVTVKLGRELFRVEVPTDFRPAEGQTVYLELDTTKMHVFDKETGLNIFKQVS